MGLKADEVLQQSKGAFAQWEKVWRENSKINGKVFREDPRTMTRKEILHEGAGKTCLCVAYASSLEDNIETLQKYNDNDGYDIICVDKAFGELVKHGIKPKYVVLCDAGVSYKDWCEPYIDDTEDVILVSNINGNIEWSKNWKGKINFFVNKDNIKSEEIFMKISGCPDLIPAGSNVGNSVVIFATHILGYDEYLLLGYDHCWRDEDNYYAFNDSPKRYWMKHINAIDMNGDFVYTSSNLFFSARWLSDYYRNFCIPNRVKMFNCSGKGLVALVPTAKLEWKLKKAISRVLSPMEKQKIVQNKMMQKVFTLKDKKEKIDEFIENQNITNVIINYVPKEALAWLS